MFGYTRVRTSSTFARPLTQLALALLLVAFAVTPAQGAPSEGPGLDCVDKPNAEPASVTITLMKAWFDADGQLTEAPDDGWGLTMNESAPEPEDEEAVAALPGNALTPSHTFVEGQTEVWPARYNVQETPAPEGWEAVDCGSLDLSGLELQDGTVNMNTSAVSVALGAPDGTFAATSTGVHLVCNQQVVEEPPVVVAVDQALRLVKFFFDADGARVAAPEGDWSVTAYEGGVARIELGGDTTSGWANIRGDYTVAETSVDGWSEVGCDGFALPDIGTDYLEGSGTGSFTLDRAEGAHAVCNRADEVDVAVLAEVIEEEPEVEVEVLAELPRTGAQTSLLVLLTVLGIGSIGLGTRLVRRR